MGQMVCKNKKCKRVLPEGYKHKYCENCRNERAKRFKDGCKGVAGVAAGIGVVVVSVVTKGNVKLSKK